MEKTHQSFERIYTVTEHISTTGAASTPPGRDQEGLDIPAEWKVYGDLTTRIQP